MGNKGKRVMKKWMILMVIMSLLVFDTVFASPSPADDERLTAVVGLANNDTNPAAGAITNWGGRGSVAVDYQRRSVGADLGGVNTVRQLELVNRTDSSRLIPSDYTLWKSDDNVTYELIEDWELETKVEEGQLHHVFTGFEVETRYIKVNTSYEDTSYTFVLANLQEDLRVYGEEKPLPEEDVYNPNLPPRQPTDLRIYAEDEDNLQEMTLDWRDNPEADLVGYHVDRHVAGTWSKLTSEPLTEANYVDTEVTSGEPVMYRITAVDEDGDMSAHSFRAGYFFDDFVDGLSDSWSLDVAGHPGGKNNGTWNTTNGTLQVTRLGQATQFAVQRFDSQSDRYSVTADLRFVSNPGEESFAGLVARYEDANTHLRLVYYPSQSRLAIERHESGESPVTLAEQTVSLSGDSHTLHVEVDGAVVSFSINDSEKLIAIDQREQKEAIAIGLVNSKATVRFDNVLSLVQPIRDINSGDALSYFGNFGPVANGLIVSSRFVDWDDDGLTDLLVADGRGTLERDVLFYRNVGTEAEPIYAPPESLGVPLYWMDVADINGDGQLDLIGSLPDVRDGIYWYENGDPTLGRRLTADGEPIKVTAPDGSFEDVRGIQVIDWTGNGHNDVLVGTGGIYYWRDVLGAPDENPPAHIYLFENQGPGVDLTARGKLALSDGTPVEVAGNATPHAVDWDNDGTLDLLSGEWYAHVNLFRNEGTRNEPALTQAERLTLDGSDWMAPERDYLLQPQVLDYDRDGKKDLILSSYSGIHYLLKNEGTDGEPVFKNADLLRAIGQPLSMGAFTSADVTDWNGDGLLDLIVGNENGFLGYFENLGDNAFAPMQYMTVNGEPIDHDAGDFPYLPIERWYGYSMPSVGDWNGDGVLDVLVSDIRGRVKIYNGTGSLTELSGPEDAVLDNGEPLRVASRTRVKMIDWNGDGRTDVVGYDTNFQLSLFERQADGKLAPGMPLKTHEDLPIESIHNIDQARHTFEVVDWNVNGKWDLLVGNLRGGYIQYYENVGTNDEPQYVNRGRLMHHDEPITDAAHYAFVAVADFTGDGFPDMISSADYGPVYFYDRRDISWDH